MSERDARPRRDDHDDRPRRGVAPASPLRGLAFAPRRRWRKPRRRRSTPADTAWMIAATALVLMMTIPGLALFYCRHGAQEERARHHGAEPRRVDAVLDPVVRVSATACASPATGPGSARSSACSCAASAWTRRSRSRRPSRKCLFMIYQMTFAIITVALVAGAVADRMRFSAFLWFAARLAARRLRADRALGLGRRLPRQGRACSTSPAAPSCISTPASPAWSPPMWSASATATARDNFAPYDLSLAVIGTGLLWVGWFGFNGGSALGANSRAAFAIVATHLAASAGALTWMVAGMVDARQAVGARHDLGRRRRPRHHHAGIRLRAAVARRRDRPDRRRALLLGLHLAQAASSAMTICSTCSASTASAARPAPCSRGVFAVAALSASPDSPAGSRDCSRAMPSRC